MRPFFALAVLASTAILAAPSCSATGTPSSTPGGLGGSSGSAGIDAGTGCGSCVGSKFRPCAADGTPGEAITCTSSCAPGVGCTLCVPGTNVCVGNEVHKCSSDGKSQDELVQTCDVAGGKLCGNGVCGDACQIAAGSASNVGCEFWAVDLDQQDGAGNDPASAPWGVVLSNVGQTQANVTIDLNDAPLGQTPTPKYVQQVSVKPGDIASIILPTRELDCGTRPNDYASPGTCLSSNAFRITSSAPIVVYQFNVFANAYSNDASLLLPTNALGKAYRVVGWGAGHPIPLFGLIDRSYVTVVGTKPNTHVTVHPSWRIRGNPPVAATAAGGVITATIGPFDVLNLETDDGTFQDNTDTIADLSGSAVESTEPVAVFSGTETTQVPLNVKVPTPPGWATGDTGFLDHLEDQMFPAEAVGMNYVITRSPIRSTGSFHEPDIIRFVGVAEAATVTTSLPPPFDSFTIQPGEVKTTWTQTDITVTSTKPVSVAQLLISTQYVDGPYLGDPSLTVFPPVEQYRTEYALLAPAGWTKSYVVVSAEVGSAITIDGIPTSNCLITPAGSVGGTAYESRRCEVPDGVRRLSGDKPFGIVAYGYGSAGSYALAGGADVKHIYDPPPIQ